MIDTILINQNKSKNRKVLYLIKRYLYIYCCYKLSLLFILESPITFLFIWAFIWRSLLQTINYTLIMKTSTRFCAKKKHFSTLILLLKAIKHPLISVIVKRKTYEWRRNSSGEKVILGLESPLRQLLRHGWWSFYRKLRSLNTNSVSSLEGEKWWEFRMDFFRGVICREKRPLIVREILRKWMNLHLYWRRVNHKFLHHWEEHKVSLTS